MWSEGPGPNRLRRVAVVLVVVLAATGVGGSPPPFYRYDRPVIDTSGLDVREFAGTSFDVVGSELVPGDDYLVVDVNGDPLGAWQRARDAVPTTGRYPVLVRDGLSTAFDRSQRVDGADPAAVLARADRLDLDGDLFRYDRPFPAMPVDVQAALDQTRAAYGDAPPASDFRGASQRDLERFLFDWAWDRPRVGPAPDLGFYEDWDDVRADRQVKLVLLPDARPWAAFAHVSNLYPAETYYGVALVVAAARRWYERYGAEPVVIGMETLFQVGRPPTDPDEAFQVARAHDVLAGLTLHHPLREYARGLTELRRWRLFDRP